MVRKTSLIAILLCLTLLLLGRTAVPNILTTEEIAEKALSATVLLTMRDADDRVIGYGSGFFVLPNVIATNFHVIEGAHRGTARRVAQNKSYTLKQLLKSDEKQDLALFEVSAPDVEPLPIGDSGSRSLRIGATVYVAGNPLGYWWGTFSEGIVSARRSWDDGVERLQMTAPISPGNSGGPVLNNSGEVIGVSVASSSDDRAQNINFAVPSSELKKLVAELNPPTVSLVLPRRSNWNIGDTVDVSLEIDNGTDIAGFQVTVGFDGSVLKYVEALKGDYILRGDEFARKIDGENQVTLAATGFPQVMDDDGVLAVIKFEVTAFKPYGWVLSDLILSRAILVNPDGGRSYPLVSHAKVWARPLGFQEDVNGDGDVNILDLRSVFTNFGVRGRNHADVNKDGVVDVVDLVRVASAIHTPLGAPPFAQEVLAGFTATELKQWLTQASQLGLTDPTSLKGIFVLEQLLKTLLPKETALLPNFPNPFNPETWIPYHLASASDVQIAVYNTNGAMVRQWDLGHREAGFYTDRSKAVYWDGRNRQGQFVASGVYFYSLTAGDFTATRKMLVGK